MNPGIIVAVTLGVAAWLYLRWKSPSPDFPALKTSPDDPLMVEALTKAKSSLAEFLVLARAPHANALVQLYFVSSSEQVEHLWADVLAVISDEELDVRLVTPPVTHSGPLERRYNCKLSDVEDWQVRDTSARVHGGFSQRAMFAIARRDGVKLPPRLLAIESEYNNESQPVRHHRARCAPACSELRSFAAV
jgi:uncharacterized protein YegJ (DUF2314 family)